MLVITLTNITNLNTSLQVGDMIYVTSINTPLFNSSNQNGIAINASNRVGILRKIDQNPAVPTTYTLSIDNSPPYGASVAVGQFIMFSKYNQSDDDIKGYYMEVKLVNDSRQKAELFSLGSEVTESSK
jgi:sRNA-binding carbon storage regulator CsrA